MMQIVSSEDRAVLSVTPIWSRPRLETKMRVIYPPNRAGIESRLFLWCLESLFAPLVDIFIVLFSLTESFERLGGHEGGADKIPRDVTGAAKLNLPSQIIPPSSSQFSIDLDRYSEF
ncbi:hypothetical protein PoB_002688000 [Plakobranchus ocellatus]|uniref:Uncharacterized protein n=1 Tax=Plakobranchus ocellatus TaxID=259542 RepID=A0AAV4A0C2_9GAST|nr:hypothetical protein PoB_002688000 [Plakobranchus ocellatus]